MSKNIYIDRYFYFLCVIIPIDFSNLASNALFLHWNPTYNYFLSIQGAMLLFLMGTYVYVRNPSHHRLWSFLLLFWRSQNDMISFSRLSLLIKHTLLWSSYLYVNSSVYPVNRNFIVLSMPWNSRCIQNATRSMKWSITLCLTIYYVNNVRWVMTNPTNG